MIVRRAGHDSFGFVPNRTSYTVKRRGKAIAHATVVSDGSATEADFQKLGEEVRRQVKAYDAMTKRPGQGFRRKRPEDAG